jgi:transcriptional regulator GlxA family with amidase domain
MTDPDRTVGRFRRPADVVAGGPQPTEPVRQARAYLRHHFAKPLSGAEVARTAGLSPSHFSALFRAATGGGVVEYTKRLWMARARELLTSSPRDIGSVGETVGYSDAFCFSRRFRTVHGHGENRPARPVTAG